MQRVHAMVVIVALNLSLPFPYVSVADEIRFTQVTIDPQPPARPWYKMVGDVSGDGLVDIVVGGARGPLMAYIAPNWKKTQLADGGWRGVNGEIADLDGDGDQDIVMGGIIWFQNPGSVDGTWLRNLVDDQTAHDIEVADLNGDGRLDIVARDQSAFGGRGNEIHVYYQMQDGWNKQTIACPHGEGLKLGDVDGDENADIVIGGLWYENPGDAKSKWGERTYTTEWIERDAKVELADINGDGRSDIILSPAELKGETYRVCWYEAPLDLVSKKWEQHVIEPSIECVIHALAVGDLDGDGEVDLAMAEMHQGKDPDEVCVLLNEDHGDSWHKQVLSSRGSHDILVVDIDRDGDLDIVGANHDGTHPLQMWRNETRGKSTPTR